MIKLNFDEMTESKNINSSNSSSDNGNDNDNDIGNISSSSILDAISCPVYEKWLRVLCIPTVGLFDTTIVNRIAEIEVINMIYVKVHATACAFTSE